VTVNETPLPDLLVVQPRVFADPRGHFFEVYRQAELPVPLLQANLSRSRAGVLRGLHYQRQQPQAKLVSVVRGSIYDVAVDLRAGSPQFGKAYGIELSDVNCKQIFIPVGFAHGFCVLSEEVDILYHCSDYYHPQSEGGIAWNDPDLGIDWPVARPFLSEKDKSNPRLCDLPRHLLP